MARANNRCKVFLRPTKLKEPTELKLQLSKISLSFKNMLPPRPSYRSFVYLATAATGFASLCAQVVWQKYLTALVGSETRSISLVVAVFLLGLALGYYVFGKITEKSWSRFLLLKLYGWAELATAVYIFVFYLYFEFLKELNFNSPAHLLMDVLISFLALLFPTFLMGASLPVLTAVLPDEPEEINSFHVRIYGWNTLGALLGVLLSGFYLLPSFGLELSLIIAGGINLIAALVFMGNKLEGDVRRQKRPPAIPSNSPNWFYILFSFFAGSIIISFEILFIRLLNLSAGAGVYNFPIILSLFVGGLALGSLSVKAHKISAKFFIRQILIASALLAGLFLISPYWSIWISHIRVSLLSIPSNYFVFKIALYLFVALTLFPAVFFMGRLLPLTYALLKKSERNYGSICGYLYFFNTLGTVFGALAVGYLAFYIFNLDDLFKINLIVLIALALSAALWERRAGLAVLSAVLAISFLFLRPWNRTGHELGYFRIRSPASFHFKSLFSLPKNYGDSSAIFFEDGPNVSVTLLAREPGKVEPEIKKLFPESKYGGVSYVVNAKGIADSIGDFSTMFLLAGMGWLYVPEREEGISSAVIGLGSGGTAGVLARLEGSADLTVLEIAPEVVENVRRAPAYSFGLLSNPKAKIIERDGFKYFTKTKKKFDLIVSEPSNPWVVGVENVFSYEFYELAKSSLAEDGVLVQWAQLYSIDRAALRIMFYTLKKSFPHAKLYRIGAQDLAIIASQKPLKQSFSKDKFFNPFLKPYFKALGFHRPEDINLIQVFSEQIFSKIADTNLLGVHSLVLPKLAYRGDKTLFLGEIIDPESLAPRYLFEADKKIDIFKQYAQLSEEEIRKRCVAQISFFCNLLISARRHKVAFEGKGASPSRRLSNYAYLRRRGLIGHKPSFVEGLKSEILEKKIKNKELIRVYLDHILSQGQYKKARESLDIFQKKDLLEESAADVLKSYISAVKQEQSASKSF